MKKALTTAQQKAYDTILERAKRYSRCFEEGANGLTVNETLDEEWCKQPKSSGMRMSTLKALEKKGYIKLFTDRTFHTGQYNPVVKGWGYSSWSYETRVVEIY